MARARTFDLTDGKVKWSDISAHANSKAGKAWGQLITDTHEKYTVDGEWLDKQWIDDDVHLDVSGLSAGDIIKISGASHSNKKNKYHRIRSLSDSELVTERMKEKEVVEQLTGAVDRTEIDELRDMAIKCIGTCDDPDKLESVIEQFETVDEIHINSEGATVQ